jgi:hypothetical protein
MVQAVSLRMEVELELPSRHHRNACVIDRWYKTFRPSSGIEMGSVAIVDDGGVSPPIAAGTSESVRRTYSWAK